MIANKFVFIFKDVPSVWRPNSFFLLLQTHQFGVSPLGGGRGPQESRKLEGGGWKPEVQSVSFSPRLGAS